MPERAKKTSKRNPAEAFAASIGLLPLPAELRFTLSFRAPAQGQYQPPHYELVIDASKPSWCTYRNYNAAPQPIDPGEVMVPVEMTHFVLSGLGKGVNRAKVQAWARSLLTRG